MALLRREGATSVLCVLLILLSNVAGMAIVSTVRLAITAHNTAC